MAEPTLKNSVKVGLDRLTEQFEEKENIVGTVKSFLEETQKVEDLAFEVNTAYDKDTAIGVQLDTIGKLVGVKREGASDEAYRSRINNQIDANTADGTINSVIQTIKNSLKESVTYPNTINLMPSSHDPSGWTGASDPDGTVTNVTLPNPSGHPYMGLAEVATGGFFGLNYFTGDHSVLSGETTYHAMLLKSITSNVGIRVQLNIDGPQVVNTYFNPETQNFNIQGDLANSNAQVTDLGDGFALFEFSYNHTATSSNVDAYISMWNVNPNGTPAGLPSTGSQMYVQAAFFGKALDFPGRHITGEDKHVKVFEHFPADVHVEVQDNESLELSNSLDEITPAGVKRTMTFIPEAGQGLVPQELETLRRFLTTGANDRMVTNDGVGGFSELVASTLSASAGDMEAGYLAEIEIGEGDAYNVLAETLRVS